jgi:hypothetical protein
MITAADIAKAIKADVPERQTILVWGDPRTGKTVLAGTIVKVPYIKRVYWLDNEHGIKSIFYAKDAEGKPLFSDEELAKIIPFNITDTKDKPRAAETVLKAFTSHSPLPLCQEHGTINCKTCTSSIPFYLAGLGIEDAVVIDSGSQLADSVLNLEKTLNNYKDLRKYYFDFTADATNILIAIQACRTNVIMTTHSIDVMNDDGDKLIGTFPLFGSGNFSRKVAKYFDHIIYCHLELNAYKKGSNTFYRNKVVTGSRRNVDIEKEPNTTLVPFFNKSI